ncbi:hypothetical protein HJFPF1_10687 [Paramyrothecium foliicola]|nr:hypothetical protein HJFPF1_10687 [Paramyrothecium foliicola]
MPGPYYKVNEWVNVMMDAALSIITIGSIIGVDEAMQGFQGRSKQKWIWHRPGSQHCPVGVEGRWGPKFKATSSYGSSNGSTDGSSDGSSLLE